MCFLSGNFINYLNILNEDETQQIITETTNKLQTSYEKNLNLINKLNIQVDLLINNYIQQSTTLTNSLESQTIKLKDIQKTMNEILIGPNLNKPEYDKYIEIQNLLQTINNTLDEEFPITGNATQAEINENLFKLFILNFNILKDLENSYKELKPAYEIVKINEILDIAPDIINFDVLSSSSLKNLWDNNILSVFILPLIKFTFENNNNKMQIHFTDDNLIITDKVFIAKYLLGQTNWSFIQAFTNQNLPLNNIMNISLEVGSTSLFIPNVNFNFKNLLQSGDIFVYSNYYRSQKGWTSIENIFNEFDNSKYLNSIDLLSNAIDNTTGLMLFFNDDGAFILTFKGFLPKNIILINIERKTISNNVQNFLAVKIYENKSQINNIDIKLGNTFNKITSENYFCLFSRFLNLNEFINLPKGNIYSYLNHYSIILTNFNLNGNNVIYIKKSNDFYTFAIIDKINNKVYFKIAKYNKTNGQINMKQGEDFLTNFPSVLNEGISPALDYDNY
jgi:hypothetical protein